MAETTETQGPTANEVQLLAHHLRLTKNFTDLANTMIAAAAVVENLLERVTELESKVNTIQ